MKLLLSATFPIPPSTNHRTIITRHGGRSHPDVTAYKWLCRESLLTAWRDEEQITEARRAHAYLSLSLFYFLSAQINKQGRNLFEIRDLDNMAQIPINVLKHELDIDDSRIIDLTLKKRPIQDEHSFLRADVLSILPDEMTSLDASEQLHIDGCSVKTCSFLGG